MVGGQADGTRCYLCDLFTTSSLKVVFQAVCWWRMVRASGQTSAFFKNGDLCYFPSFKKLTVHFIVCKNLKTVLTLCGFTFSLCMEVGRKQLAFVCVLDTCPSHSGGSFSRGSLWIGSPSARGKQGSWSTTW